METLIEFKADLELCNKLHWDWTPLHTAVLSDSPEVVDVLIRAGGDREVKDGVGRNAKDLADEYKKERVMQYFKNNK